MLEREKTVIKKVKGGSLAVTYRVPTVLDTEEHLRKDTKNSEIIRFFVTKVVPSAEGFENVTKGVDLLNLPGGTALVADIALTIVTESVLDEQEKN